MTEGIAGACEFVQSAVADREFVQSAVADREHVHAPVMPLAE